MKLEYVSPYSLTPIKLCDQVLSNYTPGTLVKHWGDDRSLGVIIRIKNINDELRNCLVLWSR